MVAQINQTIHNNSTTENKRKGIARIIIEFLKFIVHSLLVAVTVFIVFSTLNATGFLVTFIQLVLTKPKTKKVLLPVIIFTTTGFLVVIATDFYLEILLSHQPYQPYCMKTRTKLKMGFFFIHGKKL